MSFIYHKRNIPNPYAHQAVFYKYERNPDQQPETKVVDFDYTSEVNREALLIIHDACLSFGIMLSDFFNSQQLQAYAHLYPQNAVFTPPDLSQFDPNRMVFGIEYTAAWERANVLGRGEMLQQYWAVRIPKPPGMSDEEHEQIVRQKTLDGPIPSGDAQRLGILPQLNLGGTLSLVYDESEVDNRLISQIVTPLSENGEINLYTSPTTQAARLPKNQLDLTGDPDEAPNTQKLAQLVSIPWKVSLQKIKTLRQRYGLPLVGPHDLYQTPAIDRSIFVPVEPENVDIDLDNWENNLEPGSYIPRIYYNSKRNEYQYVQRTTDRNRSSYDIGLLSAKGNIDAAVRGAIDSCLIFVGKKSPENSEQLYDLGYSSPRPGHPEGRGIGFFSSIDRRPSSPWNLFVRFNKGIIDSLPDIEGGDPAAFLDADTYPYEIVNKVISTENKSSQYITVSSKFLKENMNQLIEVIRHYYTQQVMSGVGPSHLGGLDLEREIIFLEAFPSRLEKFNEVNNINSVADSDAYQFMFDDKLKLQYIIFNGNVYTVGMGLTPFTTRNDGIPMLAASYNAFYGFTSHTFSFLRNFDTILNETILKNRSPKRWMPWADFLQRFVTPMPPIQPEKQSVAKEDYTNPDSTPNIFEKISEITSRGETDARIEGLINSRNKLVDSRNRLFTEYKNAAGSCDTHLAAFGRDAAALMELAMGRVNLQYVINHALFRVRDSLIEDEFAKKCVTEGVALKDEALRTGVPTVAAAQANRLYAEVIKAVDEEIQCQIGVVADKIQSLVLSPTGAPPHASELVRGTGATLGSAMSPGTYLSASPFKAKPGHGGTTEISIELKKKQSPGAGDFWHGYTTYLGRLFDRLISQLFIGILRDVLSSAMGCNPYDNGDEEENKGLASRRKKSSYGLTNLNDYVSHINLIPLAEDLNMVNKDIEDDDTGRTVTTSPPSEGQLIQLNQDVSSILTPIELSALLDGNPGQDLLAVIREMIYSGNMAAGYSELTVTQKRDPLFREKFDNSLDSNDTLYGGLSLSDNTIKNYFSEIGGLISPANRDLMYRNQQITPELANCDLKDTVVGMPGLSDEQLVLIFDQRVQSHMSKLDSLCSIDLGFEDIQIQIDEFMNNIPDASFYTDFLEWLTGASDYLEDLLVGLGTEGADAPSPPSSGLAKASSFPDSDLGRSLMPAACDFPYAGFPSCRPGYTFRDYPIPDIVTQPPADPERLLGIGEPLPDIVTTTTPVRWRVTPEPQRQEHIPVRTGYGQQGGGTTIGGVIARGWRGFLSGFGIGAGIEVSSPPAPATETSPNAQDLENDNLGPGGLPFPLSWLEIGETIRIFYEPPGKPVDMLAEIAIPDTEDPYNQLGLTQRDRDILDGLGLPTQYTLRGIYGANNNEMGPRYANYLTSLSNNTNYTKLRQFLSANSDGIVSGIGETIKGTYEKFYYDQEGVYDSLNSFMSGISTDYFAADKKCLSANNLIIAESIQRLIKARIKKLYLNAGPLLGIYPCWNQPSTVGLLADYVSRSIIRDFKYKNNLYDVLAENFNLFYDAYGGQFPVSSPHWSTELELSLEKKLPLVVKRCLLASFRNLESSGGAHFVGKSTFQYFRNELMRASQDLADRLSHGTPAEDPSYINRIASGDFISYSIGIRQRGEGILVALSDWLDNTPDVPRPPPLEPGDEGYEEQQASHAAATREAFLESVIDEVPPHRAEPPGNAPSNWADRPELWADQVEIHTTQVPPTPSPVHVMKMMPYLPFPAQYAQAIITYDQMDVCRFSDYFGPLTIGAIDSADESFSFAVSPERLLYGGFSRGNV